MPRNINGHLRGHLRSVRGMGVCSADTILRGIRELATDTRCFDNPDSGARHGFNLNPKLNDLMVKALKQTGQFKTGRLYDLDYDNQVQPTEKYDAAKTYKKTYYYDKFGKETSRLPNINSEEPTVLAIPHEVFCLVFRRFQFSAEPISLVDGVF